MHRITKKAPHAGDGDALSHIELAGQLIDNRENIHTLNEVQAAFLVRRFRLPPARAAIIAGFAFAGGAR